MLAFLLHDFFRVAYLSLSLSLSLTQYYYVLPVFPKPLLKLPLLHFTHCTSPWSVPCNDDLSTLWTSMLVERREGVGLQRRTFIWDRKFQGNTRVPTWRKNLSPNPDQLLLCLQFRHTSQWKKVYSCQVRTFQKKCKSRLTDSSRVFIEHFSMVTLFARFAMFEQHILV